MMVRMEIQLCGVTCGVASCQHAVLTHVANMLKCQKCVLCSFSSFPSRNACEVRRSCGAAQVEYAEAVSSLYTSREGRFSDVLLGGNGF